MDSQTSGTPGGNWVKDIAFAVRDLIRQHGVGRFREMVQQWAADRDKIPVDSPAHALPLTRGSSPFADDESTPKTLAEKYACLAAIHDGICLEAEPVDPWPRRAGKSINEILCETKGDWKAALEIWSAGLVGTGYWQMVGIVKGGDLHGEQQPREGEDDLRRELLAVLEDVRVDLAKLQAKGDAKPSQEDESSDEGEESEDDGNSGPVPDPHDTRCARWLGKRIYLGNDTEVSRLFWLLVQPVGAACLLSDVQRAIDGIETSPDYCGPDDVKKANQRVRKVVSKLRAALRNAGLQDHVVIHRSGEKSAPEYAMVLRFPRVPVKRSQNPPK